MAAETEEEYLSVLKASYDYEPRSEDEIEIKENQMLFLLERTDDEWWKVKVRGETQEEDSPSGLVPAAYVEQAEHTSTVKALYDYEAAAPGELSVKEDDVLLVFDREDDWILVQSERDGGRAGFVPGNYVEEFTEEDTKPYIPQIIVPPPARPVSMYVDPADLVAAVPTKAQADGIKTWSVSEVNEKGKKKKGTLGVGNGAVFFASEADKTPVQKWQTAHIENISIEKSKHVYINLGGPNPVKLHFNVGSKDTAEAVVAKLESSKASLPPRPSGGSVAMSSRTPSPNKKNGVRFTEESPVIIPPRESDNEEEEEEPLEQNYPANGDVVDDDESSAETATAVYDFEGTSSDELSVTEGEQLYVLEKGGDDWWKCRNKKGGEGMVPASYLESTPSTGPPELVDDGAAERQARLEEAERARQRTAEDRERERKKQENERRAKAARAAAEAEAEKERREEAKAAAEAEARDKQRQEEARRAKERRNTSSPRPSSQSEHGSSRTRAESSSRSTTDKRGPPPESTRIWLDRSGEFRVEAAFLGFSNGKIRLHKSNGVVIEVPSEKMSLEDMRYVEKLMSKKNSSSRPPTVPEDDDEPLAMKKKQADATKRATTQTAKKGPTTDWFEFFLSAGCDLDDCTRYASSFERDKIDEAILPDITESTMRSLGLREGDIIRVNKVIQQKYAKQKTVNNQLLRDEELAKQLQEEENSAKKPPTGLFTSPDGLLKNNTVRRGRPQSKKSLPPDVVDLNAISNASGQIQRSATPLINASGSTSPAPVRPPHRTSSAAPVGFEDDAWTNRPSSTKPAAPTSTSTFNVPPVPPEKNLAPTPTSAAPLPQATRISQQSPGTPTLAKTDSELFDQLARLAQMKTNNPAVSPGPTSAPPMSRPSPGIASPLPTGYNAGLGMGSSPAPIGQHLQNQQAGLLPPPQNGPRGPFAPVPINQSLLQPLVPTNTGFNNFVPTRIGNTTSPFQNQSQLPFLQPQPTGFPVSSQPLISQPTGFTASSQSLISQPTGFPASRPLMSQPTGMPGGSFGNFSSPQSFQAMSSNPTGFNPSFSMPPPVPPLPYSPPNNTNNSSNTSPANIFAQMKSGTFAKGNDNVGPQPSDKYDALRVNPLAPQPTGFTPQTTGWGYQGNNGFQGGYTGY